MDIIKGIQSTSAKQRNQALKALYNNGKIRGKVKQMANHYRLKGQDYDDIFQEAIIILDENVRSEEFEQRSKIETYLVAICRNLMRDNSKKKTRVEWVGAMTEDYKDYTADEFDDHIVLRELSELQLKRDQTIEDIIKEMKAVCKESLTLYYYDNKSTAEIAEKRNLATPNQAKKALYRCRKKLRIAIEKHPVLEKIIAAMKW